MAKRDCVTIPGYGRSTRLAPRWYVGYLTYQGGNPKLPAQSLTGGGTIPAREFAGTFKPTIKRQASPVLSVVGSGDIPAAEPSLAALLTPRRGPGSF